MAMATAMLEEGTELYAKNLKFVEEEIKIHDELRPTLATPNQVRLDLRTMVLRDYGKPGGIPTLVDAPHAGHTAMIADYHKGQSLVETLLANGIAHVALTDWKSATEDKGRGYEYSKNAYIPVDDDELDAIAIESNHTIEIDSFVPREQIDERYLDSPYYITPNDQVGQDAFAVIREAMRGKGMVALARIVLAKRERVIMLQPWDKGLMGTTLRYPYEIREAKEYFDDIPNLKVEPDMLKLAEHILEGKAADFDPAQFVDHYEEAVVEMLKKKQAGLPVSREHALPRPQNVVNLIDALRRSIAQEKATSARPKKGRKRAEGQGEMLLPIAGKKRKETAAEPAERPSVRQKNVG